MAHVDKVGGADSYAMGDVDGFANGLVRCMGMMAQSVDYECVDAFQLLQCACWCCEHVGDESQLSYTEAKDRELAVYHLQWFYLLALDHEGMSRLYSVKV